MERPRGEEENEERAFSPLDVLRRKKSISYRSGRRWELISGVTVEAASFSALCSPDRCHGGVSRGTKIDINGNHILSLRP
jgi:hypothetical protein